VELAREFDRVTRRQDEEALADPDDTRTVDESVLAIPDMLGTLRDAAPAEHDLADPGRHGPMGSGDIVR